MRKVEKHFRQIMYMTQTVLQHWFMPKIPTWYVRAVGKRKNCLNYFFLIMNLHLL